MSPVVEQILQQIEQLSPAEQTQILQHLSHQTENLPKSTPPKHRANSFYGKAPKLLQGVDSQTWVHSLREEWSSRDSTGAE